MDIHAILEIPKGAKHPRAEVTELLKSFRRGPASGAITAKAAYGASVHAPAPVIHCGVCRNH